MGNKIKKLVAIVTLGLMVGVGVGVAGQATKAIDSSGVVDVGEGQVTDDVPYDYEGTRIDDDILYYYYGDDVTYEQNTRELIEALVESGHLTREEADFEIAFYSATTDEEKQKAYEDIIDYQVRIGTYSEEDGKKLKEAGYDGAYDVEVELYLESLDEMVKEGFISKEQADLEKAYLTATTDEDKKKAYYALVDYAESQGEITEQEAKEIKELGYAF